MNICKTTEFQISDFSYGKLYFTRLIITLSHLLKLKNLYTEYFYILTLKSALFFDGSYVWWAYKSLERVLPMDIRSTPKFLFANIKLMIPFCTYYTHINKYTDNRDNRKKMKNRQQTFFHFPNSLYWKWQVIINLSIFCILGYAVPKLILSA